MTYRWRLAATVVSAIAVIGVLQLPASAHHKEGHEGGPSPSPSSSPTASPSPSSSPTTGEALATPCASSAPVLRHGELRCTAVSEDGSLEIRGAVVADPDLLDCDIYHGGCDVGPWPGAYFSVGIDIGAGFQTVCSGSTGEFAVAGSCGGTVAVPAGQPVECLMYVGVPESLSAVAELSCL